MSLDSVDCFVGLDVGRETMEALWIYEEGEQINNMGFSNNHEGYEEFIEELTELSQQGFSPVVGVEGHSGEVSPLDEYLTREEISLV